MNEKIQQETRAFSEIVKGITPAEKALLKHSLIEEMRCTDRTVDFWFEGQKPTSYSQQKDIARIAKKILDLSGSYKELADTLFS